MTAKIRFFALTWRYILFPFVIMFSVPKLLFADNIYRCLDENANPVFSQLPCDVEARDISSEIKKSSSFSAVDLRPHQDPEKKSTTLEDIEKRNYRIKEERLEGAIKRLEREKNEKISEVEKKKKSSAHAGETYRLNQKIEALEQFYQDEIEKNRQILKAHRQNQLAVD